MKLAALIREIVRDVLTGTSRTLLFTVIATAVGTGLVVADTIATERIIDEARTFKNSGAAIVTVTAAGSVNGRACEALNTVPGVEAAGAIRNTNSTLVLNLLPAAPLPLYESTAGLTEVLGANDTSHAGVLVPDAVLEALGASGDKPMMTDQGRVDVVGTYSYPSDGRRPGFGWAVLAPSPGTGIFDECWALLWPSSSGVRQLLLSTISTDTIRGEDSSAQFGQLNTRLGEAFDGNSAFRARITYGVSLLAAGLGMALAVVAVWSRRLDYAARLHDGMRKGDLQFLQVAENATWSVPAAIFSSVVGCILAFPLDSPDALILGLSATVTAVAMVLGAVIGGTATMLMVRETNLFRYFKNR